MKNVKLCLLMITVLSMLLSACTDPVNVAGDPTVAPEKVETAEAVTVDETEVAQDTPEAEPTVTEELYAAKVNGQIITIEDYERQIASYQASMEAAGQDLNSEEGQQALAQGRVWVLDMMIEQALIEQAAASSGLTVTDEEIQDTLDTLLTDIGQESFDAWLADEGMSLDDMKERLRDDMIAMKMTNQIAETVPTTAMHVHAKHILLSSEAEAQNVRNQILAGADFSEMARTWSQDLSTKEIGGDLGFFPKGILTTIEVEQAAFALQPGQVSEVIQSPLGFHIVQVVEVVQEQEITADNLYILRQNAVQMWLDGLRAISDIQIGVDTTL